MNRENVQISFVGMEPTEALKKYVLEKILKKGSLLEDVGKMEIFLKEEIHSRGVEHDFKVDINAYMPNTRIRVEEVGGDMYKNIDKGTDVFFRRIKRYEDQKKHWQGAEPWRVSEVDGDDVNENTEIDDYSDYIPKITSRRVVEDMSPMEEGEAIERMELLGYDQFLFRSKKTDKVCMVYKNDEGGYSLVEPADGLN